MYISQFSHLYGFIGLSQYQEFKLAGKKKKVCQSKDCMCQNQVRSKPGYEAVIF